MTMTAEKIDTTLPTTERLIIPTSDMRVGDTVHRGHRLLTVKAQVLRWVAARHTTWHTEDQDGIPGQLTGDADIRFPVERPVFVVEYRDLDRHETVRVEFGSELDAVRAIGSYELYVNTELVGYGPNVDRSKYRL